MPMGAMNAMNSVVKVQSALQEMLVSQLVVGLFGIARNSDSAPH